jgi:hypothetical protein
MPPPRRFPPPWSIDEFEACFVVIDSTGQKLAYVYFDDEPGRCYSDNCKLTRHAPSSLLGHAQVAIEHSVFFSIIGIANVCLNGPGGLLQCIAWRRL